MYFACPRKHWAQDDAALLHSGLTRTRWKTNQFVRERRAPAIHMYLYIPQLRLQNRCGSACSLFYFKTRWQQTRMFRIDPHVHCSILGHDGNQTSSSARAGLPLSICIYIYHTYVCRTQIYLGMHNIDISCADCGIASTCIYNIRFAVTMVTNLFVRARWVPCMYIIMYRPCITMCSRVILRGIPFRIDPHFSVSFQDTIVIFRQRAQGAVYLDMYRYILYMPTYIGVNLLWLPF